MRTNRFKHLPIGRIIIRNKSKSKTKAVFKSKKSKSLKS